MDGLTDDQIQLNISCWLLASLNIRIVDEQNCEMSRIAINYGWNPIQFFIQRTWIDEEQFRLIKNKYKPLNPCCCDFDSRWSCVEQNNFSDRAPWLVEMIQKIIRGEEMPGSACPLVPVISAGTFPSFQANSFSQDWDLYNYYRGANFTWTVSQVVSRSIQSTGTKWLSLCPSQHIHTSTVISWKLVKWFCFGHILHQLRSQRFQIYKYFWIRTRGRMDRQWSL